MIALIRSMMMRDRRRLLEYHQMIRDLLKLQKVILSVDAIDVWERQEVSHLWEVQEKQEASLWEVQESLEDSLGEEIWQSLETS